MRRAAVISPALLVGDDAANIAAVEHTGEGLVDVLSA
jgi:hypothetical protein